MLCAIMQPTFLPWMGYFSMMSKVDLFVYFDDVQLAKRSWQVRNRIKGQNGELFLNIPIKKSAARDELLLCDAIMDESQGWRQKHLSSIYHSYKNFSRTIIAFTYSYRTKEVGKKKYYIKNIRYKYW